MDERITGFVIFSTQQYGFNKDQVKEYIARIYQRCERLYRENRRLRAALKKARESLDKMERMI